MGKGSLETSILKDLKFEKNHPNEASIYKELDLIKINIQKLGYFTAVYEGVVKVKNEYVARFSLGVKTEAIVIFISENLRKKYTDFPISKKDSIILKPTEVETYLDRITSLLDKQGQSFSEVKLTAPQLIKTSVYVTLQITPSKERVVNNTVIKGYDQFPQSFVERYFKIGPKSTFSKEELKKISRLTKSLDFVEEIKPPEVLFKQDSTVVYLFLKRKKNSSIDGIVNFASNDDGSGLLLNGNLDLKLQNVLNTGEEFALFWNRVKEENSEFRISSQIPYIFSSAISPSFSFNIYRQDSTFLTTSFQVKADYQLNNASTISLGYSSDSSDYLLDDSNTQFDSYSNSYWNVGYGYNLRSDNEFFSSTFNSTITLGIGNRKNSGSTNQQFRMLLNSIANISISERAYLNLRNTTGLLESDSFLTNELFRIGGANSIRGFNEQSIFTNQFSYLNIEYRYATSRDSYLHTISDFGLFQNTINNARESLVGLGFGYLFTIDNNRVNLGYALGITPNESFDFNQSKLIIRFISTF